MEHPSPSPAIPSFISQQVSEARLFYLDLSQTGGDSLRVVCGGAEQCRPDYRVHRDSFPYWSFELVVRGAGSLVLGAERVDLLPGTLFTYGPAVPHDIRADPANPPLKYFVDLAGESAARLLGEVGLAPGSIRQVADLARARQLLDQLVEVGNGPPRLRQRRCDALCEFLILSLAADAIPHGSHQSRAYLTFVRCRDLVRERFRDLSSLAEIAAACRLDQAYLCRQFRRFADETPYGHLLRLKVDHAARRLRTSTCLVKEVAAELGFANPDHFSRVFKRVHGCSPDVFLRQARRSRDVAASEARPTVHPDRTGAADG